MDKPWAGVSAVHRGLVATLDRLARTDLEILITGPSGVGKELYARHAHRASGRAAKPFVAVNCGAIPAELVENELFGHVGGAFTGARAESTGLVAEADGGTLFLDEVDALAPRNQVVLLRFLQEKEYRRLGETRVRRADVRVLAAANCDLFAAVREGGFREDLLFRLRVAPIEIPPLRDRPEDIHAIFAQYCRHYAAHYRLPEIRISGATRDELERYAWPGNIRELENCVRYLTCLQLGRPVEPADLPLVKGPARPAGGGGTHERLPAAGGHAVNFRAAKAAAVRDLERSLITQALEHCNGNITHAARSLGKPRRTFFELMRKHRITVRGR